MATLLEQDTPALPACPQETNLLSRDRLLVDNGGGDEPLCADPSAHSLSVINLPTLSLLKTVGAIASDAEPSSERLRWLYSQNRTAAGPLGAALRGVIGKYTGVYLLMGARELSLSHHLAELRGSATVLPLCKKSFLQHVKRGRVKL
ncbi:hypothetical protein MTO96_032628 [Rhipicephalus appendiculatus]